MIRTYTKNNKNIVAISRSLLTEPERLKKEVAVAIRMDPDMIIIEKLNEISVIHCCMDEAINEIFSRCIKLKAGSEMIVTDYGENKDLLLQISMFSDYNPITDEKICDLVNVVITRSSDHAPVDEIIGVRCNEKLKRELERIWNYEDFYLV